MAKRVITQTVFEDDLTGEELPEEGVQTVRFSFDGTSYEIDLSEANKTTFDEVMAPYIQSARRTGGKQKSSSTRSSSTAAASSPNENKAIREWARDNGVTVPPRGRIPADVREQYEQAHAA